MSNYQFPWEAFMSAQRQKQENQQKMMEMFGTSLANVGQNVGVGIQRHAQTGAQNQLANLMTQSAQPVQGPPTEAGGMPPQPPPDLGKFSQLFARGYPGQGNPFLTAQSNQYDPLTQAKISHLRNMGTGKGGPNSIWRDPNTKEVSPIPKPGYLEEAGLNPGQRTTALTASAGIDTRKKWAEAIGEKTELFAINNIYNHLNSLNKSSGNVLGQAATIQYRANRGKHLLNSPGIATDKLIYGLVHADLAAIAQGGSPTLAAQAEANLPTYKEMANGLLRKITADPKSINQPEIKKQLNRIFDVMDKSAKSIIDQNTEGVKALYADTPWVKSHPKAFEKALMYLGQGITPPDASKYPEIGQMPADPAAPPDNPQGMSDELLDLIASGGQ